MSFHFLQSDGYSFLRQPECFINSMKMLLSSFPFVSIHRSFFTLWMSPGFFCLTHRFSKNSTRWVTAWMPFHLSKIVFIPRLIVHPLVCKITQFNFVLQRTKQPFPCAWIFGSFRAHSPSLLNKCGPSIGYFGDSTHQEIHFASDACIKNVIRAEQRGCSSEGLRQPHKAERYKLYNYYKSVVEKRYLLVIAADHKDLCKHLLASFRKRCRGTGSGVHGQPNVEPS